MKSWERDPRTHVNVIHRMADLVGMEPEEARVVTGELERYVLQRVDAGKWIPAEITRFHTQWYREIYRVMGATDPFLEIKRMSNAWALETLAKLGLDDLRTAVVASIIANRLDYGAVDNAPRALLVDGDDFLDLGARKLLHDDFDELNRAVSRARRVLYLTDNSGEVLFDRVVIERMREINRNLRVAVAAKSSPMLNDVTASELVDLGFEEVAKVVPTGSDCFGVPEDEVSKEFIDELKSADLVIAKGQAYLEFWLGYGLPSLYHLVCTKFPVRDARLGEIAPGVEMILGSDRYREGRPDYAGIGDSR